MTGATATTPRPRKRRLSKMVGSTAGFFALCLTVYAVTGAIWGLFRPGYEAVATEDGALELAPAFNVEFTAFIVFVVVTGLLGAVLSLVMFVRSAHSRGVLMLLWVTLCAALGALVFWAAGEVVIGFLHPIPDLENLTSGTELTLVPGINIGIGFAAAPFMAVLSYWCAILVSPEDLTSAQPGVGGAAPNGATDQTAQTAAAPQLDNPQPEQ